MMRILLMVNNKLGWQVTRWLKGQSENIAGLVVHPLEKAKYRDEILRAAKPFPYNVFYGTELCWTERLEEIKDLKPDIGISAGFGYILKQEFLDIFPQGCINLHPSYLPFNRGAYPNVWSIIDGTSAGATIHYIDKGVDTGDIIAQEEIRVEPVDTGETLYGTSENCAFTLFMKTWPLIREGKNQRIPQSGEDTHHFVRDVDKIDYVDLNKEYKAGDLINLIRARTHSQYPGAYFIDENGGRIYLRLQFEYENL